MATSGEANLLGKVVEPVNDILVRLACAARLLPRRRIVLEALAEALRAVVEGLAKGSWTQFKMSLLVMKTYNGRVRRWWRQSWCTMRGVGGAIASLAVSTYPLKCSGTCVGAWPRRLASKTWLQGTRDAAY